MFFNFIQHLMTFDLGWFISLLTNNLFLLFGLMAAGYYLSEGKKMLFTFGLLVFAIWIEMDFLGYTGWVLYGSLAYLSLLYITRMALLTFTESVPKLSKHLPIITLVHAALMLAIYNIFIR